MSNYEVECPRFAEDIISRRRTLLHWPCDETPEPSAGDTLTLIPFPGARRGMLVVVTSVSKVRLVDSLAAGDGDWVRLNLGPPGGFEHHAERERARSAYWARWDAAFPSAPCIGNPFAWRVVFHYGPSPASAV